MTIATQTRTAGPFTGTGLLVSYPFAFKVFTTSDLLIQQTDATGNVTTWALGGNYTVVLNSDQNASPGGTITPLVALPAGYSITATSAITLTQGASLTNAGGFFPKTIEDALDRLTILIQQALGTISGAIRVPEISGTTLLPAAAQRVGMLLGFDGAGAPTVIAAAAQSATALALSMLGNAGATLMNYLAPFTGSVLRSQATKNADSVSILEFAGIDVTGAADSLTAAQAFITAIRAQGGDQRIGVWRKGTYKLSGALTLGSNQAIIFEPGVVINYTGDVNTALFNASNQTGVYLYGNGALINGNRAGVVLADAGNQSCFNVYGSDNVLIQDFNISGFAMDGIVITGDNAASGPSTNVRVIGCDVYNSGRNGMSIIHASGVLVLGGRYRNSNGTPSGPWAGIDIEPNANEFAQAIVIQNVRTQNNNGAGLKFVPGSMSLAAGSVYDVTVSGGRSYGDGFASSGATGYPAVHFANGGAQANEVGGQVSIRNFVIDSPCAMGVNFTNWDAANSPRVLLDFVQVINPNANLASTGNFNRSAFLLYCNTAQAITNLGKIVMRNCKAKDNRGSPSMVWGFYPVTDTGKFIQDVTFQDCITEGQTSAAKYDVNTALSATSNFIDVNVVYTKPRWLNVSGAISDAGYGGQWLNYTATGTFALPQAAWCKGLTYKVRVAATAGGNVVINRASADTIKANGVAAAASLTLQPGDSVVLVADGVGGAASWNAAAAVA